MDLRVIGDNILISVPEHGPERRESGLFVPDGATSPLVEALVVAVGPGRVLDGGMLAKPEVEVGEWVLVHRHGGLEVERGGRKLRLVQPNAIVAVVQPED